MFKFHCAILFILLNLTFSALAAEVKIKALIIDGQNNHDWRSTTDSLRATLQATGRFEVTVSTAPATQFPRVPHRGRTPEDAQDIVKVKAIFKPAQDQAKKANESKWQAWSPDFANADVVIINYNGRIWPQNVGDNYVKFIKDGGGTVLVHAANNAFAGWNEFSELIGMGWRKRGFGRALKIDPKTGKSYLADDAKLPNDGNSSHGSKHPFQVTVRAKDHPIMRGIPPVWAHTSDELYHNMRGPLKNLTVLSSSYSDPKQRGTGLHEPMTWEVSYGKGRVIVTSMGHLWPGDMRQNRIGSLYCVGFQTIFARASEYAATSKVTLLIPEGFPNADKPNPVAPHLVKWHDRKQAPSAARLSMEKKKKQNPYCMLTPDEEAETFEIAPGFIAECFASEPMVQEPVLTVWDADGAMYVAEMRGYMQDVNGESNKKLKNGRVKKLVDTDGDGKADKATIFIDGLFLPRMILPLSDGWIAVRETATMDVWAYRDTDGDGVHDEKKQLYKRGPHSRNSPNTSVEHQDSGLMWNIDNRIYLTYNMERYRYTTGEWVAERQRGHWTQWGLTHDDSGDLYWGHNSGPLVNAYLHPKYWDIPRINGNKSIPSNPIMMPAHYTPDFMMVKSICGLADRGGQAKEVRAFTSTCGQSIYRSDKFPVDTRGDYFVCDPTIHVVRRADIAKTFGMIRITKTEQGSDEFLRSSDINSRFVNTAEGPDGCLYITDMYRGIIQDAPWLNPGSRKNIVEAGLDKNIQHGRIWRIRHKDFKPRNKAEMPPMSKEPTIALVRHLASPSGWWRDTAQREIILRKDRESVVPHLKALARFDQNELGRFHAMWTLEGIGVTDLELLKHLVKDRSPLVRRAVIQIAEPHLAQSDFFAEIIEPMSKDRDAAIARQLILSLGFNRAHPKAKKVIEDIANRHAKVWGVQVAATLALWGETDSLFIQRIKREEPGGSLDKPTIAQWKNLIANWDRVLKFPDSVPKEEQKRILGGQQIYFQHCVSCHGADGKGLQGFEVKDEFAEPVANPPSKLAPSLVDSKRLKGDPQQLIPVFINGLTGPVEGKNYAGGLMAPVKTLGITRDDRLSELITYLRYVHGNGASSVSKDQVNKVRRKYEKRETPWTDEELKALKE